ncbi:MAG: hypothetical protein AAGC85_01230 [Bacteroidota bacterium]
MSHEISEIFLQFSFEERMSETDVLDIHEHEDDEFVDEEGESKYM